MKLEEIRTITQKSERSQQRFLSVVDGDPHHRFYLSMLLQRFEYRVVSAGSIEEAMRTIAVAMPALMIVDADLPDNGARQLLVRLRQERQANSPAVIGLFAGSFDPAAALRSGYDASVRKPVPAEELYRTVQALIEPTPRQNIRIHTKLPVMVNGKPLDCVEGECASVLSEHCMYIRTLKPSPAKSRIDVILTVRGRAIPISAEVRYSHHFGEGPFGEPGMGLQFTDIASHDQEYIRQFIHEDVSQGIMQTAE